MQWNIPHISRYPNMTPPISILSAPPRRYRPSTSPLPLFGSHPSLPAVEISSHFILEIPPRGHRPSTDGLGGEKTGRRSVFGYTGGTALLRVACHPSMSNFCVFRHRDELPFITEAIRTAQTKNRISGSVLEQRYRI